VGPPEAGAGAPAFDAASCQLAAAIVLTMADWPGWEAAVRKSCAEWEASRGGAAVPAAPRRGRRRGGAQGEAQEEGAVEQLPALHRLLLDLAVQLPGLVVAAGRAGECGEAPAAARRNCQTVLEALLLVAHALCRLLEHGGRGVRGLMRRRLAEAGFGLSEAQVDAAVAEGRLDWALLSKAAAVAALAQSGHGCRGRSGGGSGRGGGTHREDREGLEALPEGAVAVLMRLLHPVECSCPGAHRWVNAAAASIVSLWAVVLGPAGGAGSTGRSSSGGGSGCSAPRLEGLRAKLLRAFLEEDVCIRLAALLDDCHDEVGLGMWQGPGQRCMGAPWSHVRVLEARGRGGSWTASGPQQC
jgi:hypothetical protein